MDKKKIILFKEIGQNFTLEQIFEQVDHEKKIIMGFSLAPPSLSILFALETDQPRTVQSL